jgi:RNA recognition motif-containing protein
LYVGGLPHETSSEALRGLFEGYGSIEEARVVVRTTTGQCRGFGYVTFTEKQAAEQALTAVNGYELEGHRLRVDFAR